MSWLYRKLEITGRVQGVGFRPFIYQLARQYGLTGQVNNTPNGVSIEIEGAPNALEHFTDDVTARQPPASHIDRLTIVEERQAQQRNYDNFQIQTSSSTGTRTVQVAPDMDLCADCFDELFHPGDPRYLYPFINCTNCGPRYTLIADLPYDRPATSMHQFVMCDSCSAEYTDPGNRRFHAQPNACPRCGPQLFLQNANGDQLPGDPLAEARHLLRDGRILAIKGIGGFHLAVHAQDQQAVERLRTRKRRSEKPFAIMVQDLITARRIAVINRQEADLLQSIAKPIVLLEKRHRFPLADAVAPANRSVGIMLPYTPLHHLLFHETPYSSLVMTSGNLSEEPIIINNEEACQRLGDIADAFLLHDRPILTSNDDSVLRMDKQAPTFFRRSRGYAPAPFHLQRDSGQTLAVGAYLKNTICLTRGHHYYFSQHIGDLGHAESIRHFESVISHLSHLLQITPDLVVHDLHPDYPSTRYAQQLDIPSVAVQHHHAHAAACMAEHNHTGPVLALTLDGTGLGPDQTIWGGEILLADYSRYKRLAHLQQAPMPGGDQATRHPWRMAYAYLWKLFGDAVGELALFNRYLEQIPTLNTMLAKGIQTPLTSSCGRLFDCVSAMLQIRSSISYEGQAAIELEMVIDTETENSYPWDLRQNGPDSLPEISWEAMLEAILTDIERGKPAGWISKSFHNTLARAFTETCTMLAEREGIKTVALSGGVFQNKTLLLAIESALKARQLKVLRHQQIPPNDGGLALGQALAGRMIFEKKTGVTP